ncbi:hypothetical protein [Streptomyces sp. NPDC002769]|uniref:hypothetical protein n=1 Tax=Streptomyces sp. NPDC002769 TaxID=3154542 RepID=UPI00331D539D
MTVRIAVIVFKAALVVVATWIALITGLGLVAFMPARVQYYAISPASILLWLGSLVVVPMFTCMALSRWIKKVPGSPPPAPHASDEPDLDS